VNYDASGSSLPNNLPTDAAGLQDALRVLKDKKSASSLKKLGRSRLLLLCTEIIDKGDPIWQRRKVSIDSMVDRLMAWVSCTVKIPQDISNY
jgi:hypothetical protein